MGHSTLDCNALVCCTSPWYNDDKLFHFLPAQLPFSLAAPDHLAQTASQPGRLDGHLWPCHHSLEDWMVTSGLATTAWKTGWSPLAWTSQPGRLDGHLWPGLVTPSSVKKTYSPTHPPLPKAKPIILIKQCFIRSNKATLLLHPKVVIS